MFSKEIAEKFDLIARAEIAQYGLPTEIHYDLAMEKGLELARKLWADENLVKAGIALMDSKLGYSVKVMNDRPGHVKYGVEFTESLLKEHGIEGEHANILINSVAAHHKVNTPDYNPFDSLEAEIVANADCYEFLHPKGFMEGYAISIESGMSRDAALRFVEAKVEEKHNILSLPEAKEELEENYPIFKAILTQARS